MKKVSFGQSDLEFMFEDKSEIKRILSGENLEINLGGFEKKVVFGLDYEDMGNSFSFEDSLGKSSSYNIKFSKNSLNDFLEGNCGRMNVIQGFSDVCVYGVGYNNTY